MHVYTAFQKELDTVVKIWDGHLLQRNRNVIAPSGKPIIMYAAPELYNTTERLIPVNHMEVEVCLERCLFKGIILCQDQTVYELCCDIMVEHNKPIPSNAEEAKALYLFLRDTNHQSL